MTDEGRFLTIRRTAAADPELDIDFLQGNVDIDKLKTYDEADAFDKDGGPNLAKDDNAMAKGTEIEYSEHRGKLSAEERARAKASADNYKPTKLELKRAEVAAKIAALMLPNANAEAIENQAAIFARRFSTQELVNTLERCYCDRKGAKIAAQKIAERQRRLAMEEGALDEISALADDVMVDEGEAKPEDEVAKQVEADATCASDDATAGFMQGKTSGEGEGEVELEEEPEEPKAEDDMEEQAASRLTAGRKIEARPVSRTASAKQPAKQAAPAKQKSPAISHPQRRSVTAAEAQQVEIEKLSAIYDRKVGNPSKEDYDKVMSLFVD